MNLLEYEAKNMLKKYSIPTPEGEVISDAKTALTTPIVLKSQVPTGGRGKLGGIKIVNNEREVRKTIVELLEKEIAGFKPSTLLAEEKLSIKQEFYLSVLINRELACIELVANTNGGVDVEENSVKSFLRLALEPGSQEACGEQLAEYLSLESHSFLLQDLVENLYRALTENDATLIEINPLVLTDDNRLIAGDAKVVLDDSASFRHPEWQFETVVKSSNFVVLDEQGEVATVANGAGLAMATVDAIASEGLRPANFLDIGGGANSQAILETFRKIQRFSNIKAIVINIFAGITRCDQVAIAIVEALDEMDDLPPLFVRLAGTGFSEAESILAEHDIDLLPTLEAAIQKTKELVS